ncbi:Asp-tRNA(Asn)/Glu-tRNA(Gln) amidotransferase subunit GatA [Fulvivirga lutea]|uniref:Glutamyl-tRNA(Gln) amidotransferase subunit A n=1 Tax=Fulvivirga lutea TaxID=2810512 RepID=A0A974WGX5_9BACT|nr:Asp-tRNA(Asn)/Glu-tRNA(Gln) amidotransferase subunit GatA [Fulvivirga lutea]QSE97493.1 Asp-tRNA(Asn)/Glu-tRNA(Gln) amidotransferase subunit GatA [Fulvivirga lutea]
MNEYSSLSLIQKDLKSGSISCSELVNHYLERINSNEHLNALVEVYADEAKAKALEVDKKIKSGTSGRLAGMVVTLKDVLCHKDHKLSAGSKILEGFESQFNGTAVQRLIDEDAIIIGRNNCDEFAMGSSNENSAFGPTLNGADNSRVPGGSSGGSAVAVQAGMCLVSLGSDTGGSVRQPAAFCGIIGLKPTYSRISRHGLLAYASSFDCIGIFAKDTSDVAIVLEVISGEDEFDSTVSKAKVDSYSNGLNNSEKKLKIAYIKETLDSDGLNDEIRQNFNAQLTKLNSEGHKVEPVEFPLLDYILPTYYILTTAEASSNLSRFDGVRYGYRSKDASSLESMYKNTRSEGFGEEVKRRIMLGTFVLSASYYDAYYNKAQKVRRLIREASKSILSKHDFIITPTTPTTAFKIGEHQADPLAMYLADLYTVQASVAGLPAISVPSGHDSSGLPVGIQVIANDFEEAKLLSFSKYLMTLG